ncbi:MAG: RHS repeat-associated core domain-containing protein [Thermoanaerobaculia bacterium]
MAIESRHSELGTQSLLAHAIWNVTLGPLPDHRRIVRVAKSTPGVRFLSEDPLGYAAGINLYAYVYSDPIAAKDPRGLVAVCSGVPDATPGVFDFTDACHKHDNCYGTCGRSKPECDWDFYENMRAECARQATRAGTATGSQRPTTTA